MQTGKNEDSRASYEEIEQLLAHYCKTIGHPARIAILKCIAEKGGEIEGESLEIPQISYATVIQHLRELKRSGLIQGRIFGARAHYRIDKDKLASFQHAFEGFVSSIQST